MNEFENLETVIDWNLRSRVRCALCKLPQKIIKETEEFLVFRCPICLDFVATLKQHTRNFSPGLLLRMDRALKPVADDWYGTNNWWVDYSQKEATSHLHLHARAKQRV